jgi:thiosulfate dehydrogenase [quinone] large subunit
MASKGRGIFLLRIVLGWGFFFAGIEKLFALGGAPFSAGGFLTHATGGSWPGVDAKTIVNPTHGLWVSIGSNAGLVSAINVLVVAGEIAIGACLILGLATRFAGIMGAVMTGLFYVAAWSFANGIVNEQLLFAVTGGFLAYVGAGQYYGLDAVIAKSSLVARAPALKYLVV